MMKLTQFLKFLSTNDRNFHVVVVYVPLIIAASGLIWYLLKGKNFTESFSFAGLIFLLGCFVGIVSESIKRRNVK